MAKKLTQKKTLCKRKSKFYVSVKSSKCIKYPVWKWWERKKISSGKKKWKSLEHNGPHFAPEYQRVPKHVKFYYGGVKISLSKDAEEVAGFYGRMLNEKYTKKKIFNANFFRDWREVMTPRERNMIVAFRKCNFQDFYEYYKEEAEQSKHTKNREKIKKDKEKLASKYGFCLVDGNVQKVANFRMEPPSLFRGRGNHPKMGKLKKRILPEDVTINVGKNDPVPKPPRNHKWKDVVHDNTLAWLARWTDSITNSSKYMRLHPSSKLRGELEVQKYELARKLKRQLRRIRAKYMKDLDSEDEFERQRAVVLYFIDKLALRAGYEKEFDTADTVGCCSLRVEHIALNKRYGGDQWVIHLDFPGKDNIRYEQSVSVDPAVYENVEEFIKHKSSKSLIFDTLNPSSINNYLNELMENLTAKVFRTCHASVELETRLKKLTKRKMCLDEKLQVYNIANRAAAILCNHYRVVPKASNKTIKKIQKRLKGKKLELEELLVEIQTHKKTSKKEIGDEKCFAKQYRKVQLLEKQILKLQLQQSNKMLTRDVALNTTKLNYLDPRISIAWCKKWDVPVEKIYNKTQRERFVWAIETTSSDFKF